MMFDTMDVHDIDVRRQMAAMPVTLNGHEAKVCGVRYDYATVQDWRTGVSFSWSWEAVARIITHHDGAFES